jgi:hypothetical protein
MRCIGYGDNNLLATTDPLIFKNMVFTDGLVTVDSSSTGLVKTRFLSHALRPPPEIHQ